MGKVAQNSVKYVVKAKLESNGMVEKPDVVGAIFGQTEGLLGEDLDLRELQERGKVGRIDVKVKDRNGCSEAFIKIPSSLDSTETALLGASLETIERVGPTNAEIKVREIEDQRTTKRDYIVKRAKQLLEDMQDDKPETAKITDEVKQEVRTTEITDYIGFKAGPEAENSEEVVIVEGKADILNLMEKGVKNTVCIGGTSVPDNLVDLAEEKKLTAFLDGDRGGDLILKEMKSKIDLEYVARAPNKKEVEELGKETIYEALRDKEPVKYTETAEVKSKELTPEEIQKFQGEMEDLIGTRAVYVMNSEMDVERRFPVESFDYEIEQVEEGYAVLMDGELDNKKISKAEDIGCDILVGMDRKGNANSSSIWLMTKDDLEEKTKVIS